MIVVDKTCSQLFKTSLILLIGLLPVKQSFTSPKSDMPILQQTDIPQHIIEKTDYYNGKELYGYINGGAEIFLEYGFQKMAMQKIVQSGKEIMIEIYHMKNPAAALGIFSTFTSNCSPLENIGSVCCLSKYQLNFAKGNFYVNLTNFEGTPSLQQISKKLAEKIQYKIANKFIVIPEFFQTQFTEAELRQIKYFQGKLGMQNIWPEFVPLMENLNNYSVYLLQIHQKEYIISIAELFHKKEENRRSFLKNFADISSETKGWQTTQRQKKKIAIKLMTDHKMIYIQTPAKNPDFQSFIAKLIITETKNEIKLNE
jgi:hypothetical protein